MFDWRHSIGDGYRSCCVGLGVLEAVLGSNNDRKRKRTALCVGHSNQGIRTEGRKGQQYWATSNHCYLNRDDARTEARQIRSTGEEARVVKFVMEAR